MPQASVSLLLSTGSLFGCFAPPLPLGPLAASFALLSNERSSTHSLSFVSFYSFSVPSIGRTMLLIPAQTCCVALFACDLADTAKQRPFFIQIIASLFS